VKSDRGTDAPGLLNLSGYRATNSNSRVCSIKAAKTEGERERRPPANLMAGSLLFPGVRATLSGLPKSILRIIELPLFLGRGKGREGEGTTRMMRGRTRCTTRGSWSLVEGGGGKGPGPAYRLYPLGFSGSLSTRTIMRPRH
jgi:hypothetical protein